MNFLIEPKTLCGLILLRIDRKDELKYKNDFGSIVYWLCTMVTIYDNVEYFYLYYIKYTFIVWLVLPGFFYKKIAWSMDFIAEADYDHFKRTWHSG